MTHRGEVVLPPPVLLRPNVVSPRLEVGLNVLLESFVLLLGPWDFGP